MKVLGNLGAVMPVKEMIARKMITRKMIAKKTIATCASVAVAACGLFAFSWVGLALLGF